MNKPLVNLGLLGSLFILAVGCATKKTVVPPPAVVEKPVVKTFNELEEDFDSLVEKKWVDSVYQSMGYDERIGQLFMVSAYSNKDSLHIKSIDKLIQENKIGGLIFFQGGPVRQAKLTNRYQAASKVPLLIGIDAEWGLSMRLDSTYRYPFNMTLGAIENKKLIEKVGEQMGQQNKRIGVHFNFAPVLDINTNPKNPIIGFRSFGENKENVTQSALALMKGYQGQGLISTGKHFPGHGDTEVDSHNALPTINFTRARLDSLEMYPYKKLFQEGLASVMVAHLNVPSIEPRADVPSSVSHNIITDVLKNELGFKGLIFTDALNMKAAKNFRQPGDIDLEAFMAGNDILLCAENVPVAAEKICLAMQDSLISEERLAYSVKKILKYKYKTGLNHYQPVEINNLYQDLNTASCDALQYDLYENAVTVVKNHESTLPIRALEKEKIAYVKLGDDQNSTFVNTLKKYTDVTEINDDDLECLKDSLRGFTKVIVGFHKIDKAWKSQNMSEKDLLWLNEIAKDNTVILDAFTRPYALSAITDFSNIEAVIVSYQNSEIAQTVSAELIFGAIAAQGKLPVSINEQFKAGVGMNTEKLNRIGFAMPENVGMNSATLCKIENFTRYAMTKKMAPGMQILVARKGKVVYHKSFGSQTYEADAPKINNNTVYDIASLTKIIGTLPLVMQQYDTQKINLETPLKTLLPIFDGSYKQDIPLKDLLSHYARLQAWIPFYKATLDANQKPLSKYYSKVKTTDFSKQVADSLFIRNDYHDSIMKQIVQSPLLEKKEYKYSDFTFIILRDYLEKSLGKRIDQLATETFFAPLGMNNTVYNPLNKFDKRDIPPTEDDHYFRYQIIQGYVHDMEAAMEGGLGGHAGLFSNAIDLAKMMQLYLNKGFYGGRDYFSTTTFDTFNTCHFCTEGNRRGLGLDKPQLPGTSGPTCGCTSMSSFGHTGFTGTIAWADPEAELIYIFLSNRTFPDATVNQLSKENIREDIQKVIYEAINK
ncbi:MAG: glycoside hydrolase family 3 N-terminal domain-containing protein [Flavobacteriaceae bacterium]